MTGRERYSTLIIELLSAGSEGRRANQETIADNISVLF